MFQSLEELTRHPVFHYFQEISNIPRCSGHEKEISDYLVRFAKERNLEAIQDEALNVIIKKPATEGYEQAPVVILQGHMDMVCEKNQGTKHNFEHDPIRLKLEGDMLYATDTTLGADNGIAVAYALALLDSNEIPHPALEVVITTEEETTMTGAISVDPSHFTGELFINLDSEEEGKLLVSSAGGVKGDLVIPISWTNVTHPLTACRLSIRGLKGGHSGMMIDKERGNANKLLGRVLYDLFNEGSFLLCEINGGLKSNAIPREADAILLVEDQLIGKVEQKIKEWNDRLKTELRVSDPDVSLLFEKVESPIGSRAFSKETTEKVIHALMLTPNGVQKMSLDIEGLVETSTNLGVVATSTKEGEVVFQNEIRSSVKSEKEYILNQVKALAEVLHGKLEISAGYPEWAYKPDSAIRELCQKVYKEMYGKEAEIVAIHAGLECGVFTEKIPGLDVISIGPDMYNVHTPDEHISITSAIRTWEYLLAVLKDMKNLKKKNRKALHME
ncbi:aminoacyl-histidine dipeptidase [Fictibacillus sp. Mic-4]|uniref:aminoacyl-histidine dipeptidase n=1 Tax=Fictibacillus sp. Mic-4 TaxID=3132826 RepID=UPI003CF7687B